MLVSQFAKLALTASTLLGQYAIAHNGCDNPYVRREWRSLSLEERAGWIDACLGTLPHNSSLVPTFNTTYSGIPPLNASGSYFDDLVYIHMDLNPIVHFTAQFLPWHRAYVKHFETVLQEKCGYTGTQPYWDWTLDASNFGGNAFWDPDPTTGVGGLGDPNDDYRVPSGGFATGFSLSYPLPHRLRRRPATSLGNSLNQITPENVAALVNGFAGTFIGFQVALENGPHFTVHGLVGGDLGGQCPANAPADCAGGAKWSSNDPLFMMHHGMVDKLWYDWQHAHPSNFWSFGGGAVSTATQNFTIPTGAQNFTFPTEVPPFVNFSTPIPTDGVLEPYTIYELMDTRGDRLCYIYE